MPAAALPSDLLDAYATAARVLNAHVRARFAKGELSAAQAGRLVLPEELSELDPAAQQRALAAVEYLRSWADQLATAVEARTVVSAGGTLPRWWRTGA